MIKNEKVLVIGFSQIQTKAPTWIRLVDNFNIILEKYMQINVFKADDICIRKKRENCINLYLV